MNGFIKKSIGTLTLGEKLQKIRTDKRMSLSEISRQTRIQTKYLERLERGDWENLPADVYVRGFIKSYVDFFGLDEGVFLRMYEKERGIKNNLDKEKNENKKEAFSPISISFFSVTPKKVWISLAIFLVFLVLIFVYNEVGSFANTPKLIILSPENNTETEGNSITISGITEKDSRLLINGQPVLVNDEGKFLENITLQSGSNLIAIKSINRFNKESETILTINSKLQEQNFINQEVKAEEIIEENSRQEITLEVSVDPGPVWLRVEADGELVFNGTVLSGSVQSFKAKEKIVVDSGKGSATLVKFNGGEKEKLSEDSSAVKGITFNNNSQTATN